MLWMWPKKPQNKNPVFLFLFYSSGCTYGIWKRLNPSGSCDKGHRCGDTRSLTYCSTAGTPKDCTSDEDMLISQVRKHWALLKRGLDKRRSPQKSWILESEKLPRSRLCLLLSQRGHPLTAHHGVNLPHGPAGGLMGQHT